MIYELRSYDLKVGTTATYMKRFGEGLPTREKYSKLAGFWSTDVGPLNQVIHLWVYEDMKHRDDVREASAKDTSGQWPPKGDDCIVHMESEIILPAPFMRPLDGTPQELGGIYELRYYDYQVGSTGKVYKTWEPMIPAREKLSPLALCGFTELGGLNKFFHLWPYKDMNERLRIRREAVVQGIWPPPTSDWVIRQQNKIMFPAPFSPLR
ncbi:MAG: hypothetical protein EXR52_00400 [Dehalococcoidia bacterium]|nr:hypothetical protein [Dehalococcoidia bacterium]